MGDQITLPMALIMSAGSTLAGMAGTWAVMSYKVERALSSANRAHERLDKLEPTVTRHGVLHEEHDKRLQVAMDGFTKALDGLRAAVEQVSGKMDKMIERELERGA